MTEKPDVKRLSMDCRKECRFKAFIHVVVVKDAERQKKIDQLARKRMRAELKDQHEKGLHNA